MIVGQAMFISGMIAVLIVLLGWLLTGGMHRSAHPNGEQPQFAVLIEGLNHRLYEYYAGLWPKAFVIIGRMYTSRGEAWGIRLGWDFDPTAKVGDISYRGHWQLGIQWQAPKLRIVRGW